MTDLCFTCNHRAESIARAKEALELYPGKGVVCDPAPRAECKYHTLYGYKEDESKTYCDDYIGKGED